jgi:hypothetical protein
MTYKMPADIGRQLGMLIRQLLYIIFAEIPLSQFVKSPDIFHGLGLGYGYQLDPGSKFMQYVIIIFLQIPVAHRAKVAFLPAPCHLQSLRGSIIFG